jgi:predicted lipase
MFGGFFIVTATSLLVFMMPIALIKSIKLSYLKGKSLGLITTVDACLFMDIYAHQSTIMLTLYCVLRGLVRRCGRYSSGSFGSSLRPLQ